MTVSLCILPIPVEIQGPKSEPEFPSHGRNGAKAKGSPGRPEGSRCPGSASGLAGASPHPGTGLCVSGWSPTCAFQEGVLGTPWPPSTLAAQLEAAETAWTAQRLTVPLRGGLGCREAGLTGPSTQREQAGASSPPGAPV